MSHTSIFDNIEAILFKDAPPSDDKPPSRKTTHYLEDDVVVYEVVEAMIQLSSNTIKGNHLSTTKAIYTIECADRDELFRGYILDIDNADTHHVTAEAVDLMRERKLQISYTNDLSKEIPPSIIVIQSMMSEGECISQRDKMNETCAKIFSKERDFKPGNNQ